jgi:serine/threonine-protein kinase
VTAPQTHAPHAADGTVDDTPAGPGWSGPPADRYVLQEELARGGMGVVVVAHDRALGRTVAVKLLRPEFADRPALVGRFVEEARITGRLQHPGVPPIYDVGTRPDGSPFLAMKLIRGRTLADQLRDRAGPGDDLPRFLQVFEQIAQTVAFAHSNGVIHRDLKPANVMVGAFGEVQVMDWGLAKRLPGAEAGMRTDDPYATVDSASGPQSEIRTPRSDLTQAGSVLGTPAYMPPEQANGDIARTDRRADVFSLGAILCELLTGRPAYLGDMAARLAQATAGDNRIAVRALSQCGADPELVQLAARCLAADPDARPADAGEVAAAVVAYRTGVEARLRQAEVDRAAADARAAEQRKRRRVQLALGLVVLAVSATATAVWSAYVHQRGTLLAAAADRKARVATEVKDALDETDERIGEAWNEEADPDRFAAGAKLVSATFHDAERSANVGSGEPLDPALTARLADTRARADDLTRRAKLVSDAERVVREHAERINVRTGASRSAPQRTAAGRLADAFRAFGLDPTDPNRAAEIGQAVAADRQRDRLMTYLTELALWSPADQPGPAAALRAARRAAGGVFARWQAVADAGDAAGLETLAADPEVLAVGPLLLNALARELAAAGRSEARLALLRRAADKYPQSAFTHHDLAEACYAGDPPMLAEALRHATAAAALVPGSSLFQTNLGFYFLKNDAPAAALPCLRKAVALDPTATDARTLLAEAEARLAAPALRPAR